MPSGIYTFRAENFTLDQQASTTNDSLILSVYYKIDDAVTKHCFSVPIARQIYSGTMVDLGRWAESEPIEVADESLITVIYQVLNITGGWDDPFTTVTNELNSQILPGLQAIGSLVDINVQAYTNVILGALNFIYNSSSAPPCSGLVHLHSDQYLGVRLGQLTAGYKVHRVANSPSQALTPPSSGCNTPASRLSLAVEAVPPRLAVAGPSKSSNKSIVIARSLPLGPTTAFLFNPADPTKFVEPEFSLSQAVVGNVSCVVPTGGNDKAVSPIHLFGLAQDDRGIMHAYRDASGWHTWQRASNATGFSSLVALAPGSVPDLFVIDAAGALLHSKVAADGTLSSFAGAPANPNPPLDYSTGLEVNPLDLKIWGNTVQITGTWSEGKGCSIYAGLPPVGIETYWGTRVAGGLQLNANFTESGAWTINWPYDDAEFPSFMMLGPDAITNDGAYAIGHGGQLNSNYDAAEPEAGQSPYTDFAPVYPSLPGPDAAQVASALNSTAGMLWLALLGTDQQIWVGASLVKEKEWFPVNGIFTSLGGPFIGRPVIVPDPSGDTNRTYFFATGVDGNVYWKYFDFKQGDTALDGTFTPAGKQWASLPDKDSKVTLTGPIDPGPAVEIVNDPTKVLSNLPSLSVSNTRVAPGASLSVVGDNFPLPSATELQLEWPNTSTGTPTGAQLKYQIKGKDTTTSIDVPVPPHFTGYGVYMYTVTALVPNTEYEFWARCSDTVGWSAWSSYPLTVKTSLSSDVQLILKLQSSAQSMATLGNQALSATSQLWKLNVTIPSTTVAGAYNLVAQLDGAPLASAAITVATTALAQLQIIDPATNQIVTLPILVGGDHFTVRGSDYPNGPVSIGIAGVKVASVAATNGTFVATLTVPGSPSDTFGTMTVVASGGGVSASVQFQSPAPLK
jgi:hypothetical protein